MNRLPLLRCRSEFSFRAVFGSLPDVAAAVADVGAPVAALVDRAENFGRSGAGGTWGHVKWQKELAARDVQPAFGAEFALPNETKQTPSCWTIAEDTKKFYNFTSSQPSTPEEFAAAEGVIRFAGTGLTDPSTFDYIDLNQASRRSAKRALQLHKETGRPLALAPVNFYPTAEDHGTYMLWASSDRNYPMHFMDGALMRDAFGYLSDDQYATAFRNTMEIGERLRGITLPVAPQITVEGNLREVVEAGRKMRLAFGHIGEWTEEYQQRLDRELEMIELKNYDSYFLVVADLVDFAKTKMLVGPARGSSAGSLVCYLLRITEVDPLVHNLLFERFIDVNRDDLPDIDIDFNDTKRYMVFDYLAAKYGESSVAHIGSINTLKPRSIVAHASKAYGIDRREAFAVLNVLIEYSSGDSRYGNGLADTLTTTQPGKDFIERHPEATRMGELENHASHSGVHAAGILVAHVPVTDYCTVVDGVAQVDKYDAEDLGLLKIDALGLRTLGVIEDADCLSPDEFYSMTYDDPEVFKVFNEGKYSGLFQFEGAAQRRVASQIEFSNFRHIDQITALARPGPLGGGATNHYTNRFNGREEITYRHPTMAAYLEDTLGVVLYQEQVMRIVRELGQFSWEETSTIRKAMSGRKGKEFFDARGDVFSEGAAAMGISYPDAQAIWNEICSFGAWGMNASHTCSYGMISYWCAYMKRYHHTEYAAACLRSAKDEEQTIEILRELAKEGVECIPFDPHLSDREWQAKDGHIVGGYTNLIGIGPVKATAYINKREGDGLEESDLEKLGAMKTKFDDLTPGRTLWGHIYDDPVGNNINGPVSYIENLTDRQNCVIICKMVRNERRDKNEAVLIARRNGQVHKGNPFFLDMFVVDDSIGKPVLARINPKFWNRWGVKVADRAVAGKDWFLLRGVWLEQFNMMSIDNIKCLTNEEMFL